VITTVCRCGELNDRADAARKKIEEDLSQALIRSPASFLLLFRVLTNVSELCADSTAFKKTCLNFEKKTRVRIRGE
jgi:hypothetical protein